LRAPPRSTPGLRARGKFPPGAAGLEKTVLGEGRGDELHADGRPDSRAAGKASAGRPARFAEHVYTSASFCANGSASALRGRTAAPGTRASGAGPRPRRHARSRRGSRYAPSARAGSTGPGSRAENVGAEENAQLHLVAEAGAARREHQLLGVDRAPALRRSGCRRTWQVGARLGGGDDVVGGDDVLEVGSPTSTTGWPSRRAAPRGLQRAPHPGARPSPVHSRGIRRAAAVFPPAAASRRATSDRADPPAHCRERALDEVHAPREHADHSSDDAYARGRSGTRRRRWASGRRARRTRRAAAPSRPCRCRSRSPRCPRRPRLPSRRSSRRAPGRDRTD